MPPPSRLPSSRSTCTSDIPPLPASSAQLRLARGDERAQIAPTKLARRTRSARAMLRMWTSSGTLTKMPLTPGRPATRSVDRLGIRSGPSPRANFLPRPGQITRVHTGGTKFWTHGGSSTDAAVAFIDGASESTWAPLEGVDRLLDACSRRLFALQAARDNVNATEQSALLAKPNLQSYYPKCCP
jgi:hypothetical protein